MFLDRWATVRLPIRVPGEGGAKTLSSSQGHKEAGIRVHVPKGTRGGKVPPVCCTMSVSMVPKGHVRLLMLKAAMVHASAPVLDPCHNAHCC